MPLDSKLVQNNNNYDERKGESPYYKDVAIIRYNKRTSMRSQEESSLAHGDSQGLKGIEEEADEDKIEHVKVVRDTEFLNEFSRRPSDLEWFTINCVQTCIKAKSIGILITINFLAPIKESTPYKEIEYGLHAKAMPEDAELLKSWTTEDDEVYA